MKDEFVLYLCLTTKRNSNNSNINLAKNGGIHISFRFQHILVTYKTLNCTVKIYTTKKIAPKYYIGKIVDKSYQ